MHETTAEKNFSPAGTPGKSQRKREMKALRELAVRLTKLATSHIERIPYADIKSSIHTARSLTKGNARKRQIQYISKQLKTVDLEPITEILDRLDASSATHIKQFHQLEKWRERLTSGDSTALEEICQCYPDTDRQHLRTLVRNAIAEKRSGYDQVTHFRKVFRYLKELTER